MRPKALNRKGEARCSAFCFETQHLKTTDELYNISVIYY